jgi:hypothetical protein
MCKKIYKNGTLMWYKGNCLYEQPLLYVQRDGNYDVIFLFLKTSVVICLQLKNALGRLVRKPEGKEPLGMYRSRYEDVIKIDTEEIGCEGVNWICVAQDGDWLRTLSSKK